MELVIAAVILIGIIIVIIIICCTIKYCRRKKIDETEMEFDQKRNNEITSTTFTDDKNKLKFHEELKIGPN